MIFKIFGILWPTYIFVMVQFYSSSSLAIVINSHTKTKTKNKTKTKIEGIVRYLQSTLLFTRYYIPKLFLQWCCRDCCWLASVLWCCYYFLGSFQSFIFRRVLKDSNLPSCIIISMLCMGFMISWQPSAGVLKKYEILLMLHKSKKRELISLKNVEIS